MPDGPSSKSTVAGPLKLFSLFVKSYKPVSTNSIARWIKLVLSNAGIDAPVFKGIVSVVLLSPMHIRVVFQ